jgi:hypothetical protein
LSPGDGSAPLSSHEEKDEVPEYIGPVIENALQKDRFLAEMPIIGAQVMVNIMKFCTA